MTAPLTVRTRAELSALVATEVAGWCPSLRGEEIEWITPDGKTITSTHPDFADSADAVLPLLDRAFWRCGRRVVRRDTIRHCVEIWDESLRCYSSEGKSLPIAACLAVLRAKGIAVDLAGDFK